jgi:cellulose synthase/poly-beta-1,6-N-acetylglucosamine synthase-like glycosyltransferase
VTDNAEARDLARWTLSTYRSFGEYPVVATPVVPRLVALVPAHNEASTIQATVLALLTQDLPVTRLIVICDNCSDDTERIAREAGAETYVTVDNTAMKAGGLNQALALVLPDMDDTDMLAAVDADSIVGSNFTSEAAKLFAVHPTLGGVSGTYQGKAGGGSAGYFQRNEFARWGFDNRMYHGRTVILSGAASIFTVGALRRVLNARINGGLPGKPEVYNEDNITEDFELSLALLHTNSRIMNMLNVNIMTAVKPTWRELGIQRLRWDRGINEGLFQYGITRFTRKVWFQRIMYALFVPVSLLILVVIANRAWAGDLLEISPLWVGVSGIMMFQKAFTIRTRGIGNMLIAFAILPELPYDTYLQMTFVRSLWDQVTHRAKKWR